ncbi:MAG: hypothetical protein EON93_18175 [Burkholderiales bacterium]|nr:MAG: hypothetical protein EON93_18175 [Burkholderiales bacterium]
MEPRLLAFIRSSIPSIWALELLLLLRRAAPQALTRDEMVQHLRATPNLIERLITQFLANGLVTQSDSTYRFECATPELAALCEDLAMAADERPIALRDAIIAAPNEKLRDLADAFRFRDTDKGGSGGPKGGHGK